MNRSVHPKYELKFLIYIYSISHVCAHVACACVNGLAMAARHVAFLSMRRDSEPVRGPSPPTPNAKCETEKQIKKLRNSSQLRTHHPSGPA